MKKVLLIISLFSANILFSCPLINSIVDYNCNGYLKISVLGDSIVHGHSDTGGAGGYVEDLANMYPYANIKRLGVSGIRTDQLLRKLKDKDFDTQLRKSDMIFIDVGRNDYWYYYSPSWTVTNIKRTVKHLYRKFRINNWPKPFIVVSTMIPVNRYAQGQFVTAVNKDLLRLKSKNIPTYLKYHKLSNSVLSSDTLHPDAAGYQVIANKMKNYIENRGTKTMKKRRPDTDLDGIYDYFEMNRYYTNENVVDSDGDLVSDGVEVYFNGTDPLDALDF